MSFQSSFALGFLCDYADTARFWWMSREEGFSVTSCVLFEAAIHVTWATAPIIGKLVVDRTKSTARAVLAASVISGMAWGVAFVTMDAFPTAATLAVVVGEGSLVFWKVALDAHRVFIAIQYQKKHDDVQSFGYMGLHAGNLYGTILGGVAASALSTRAVFGTQALASFLFGALSAWDSGDYNKYGYVSVPVNDVEGGVVPTTVLGDVRKVTRSGSVRTYGVLLFLLQSAPAMQVQMSTFLMDVDGFGVKELSFLHALNFGVAVVAVFMYNRWVACNMSRSSACFVGLVVDFAALIVLMTLVDRWTSVHHLWDAAFAVAYPISFTGKHMVSVAFGAAVAKAVEDHTESNTRAATIAAVHLLPGCGAIISYVLSIGMQFYLAVDSFIMASIAIGFVGAFWLVFR